MKMHQLAVIVISLSMAASAGAQGRGKAAIRFQAMDASGDRPVLPQPPLERRRPPVGRRGAAGRDTQQPLGRS